MFKRHWEKYPRCAIAFYYLGCISSCGIYFSFDLNVHCGDVPVDRLLNLVWSPSFVNLLGLTLVLCLRLDFYPSGLVYWYHVWELLKLAPSVSTIGSVYLFLLFARIFDSGNCLAWNSLCESRDMLLEQCLKQCLWTVMSQIVFGFSNWFFCQ